MPLLLLLVPLLQQQLLLPLTKLLCANSCQIRRGHCCRYCNYIGCYCYCHCYQLPSFRLSILPKPASTTNADTTAAAATYISSTPVALVPAAVTTAAYRLLLAQLLRTLCTHRRTPCKATPSRNHTHNVQLARVGLPRRRNTTADIHPGSVHTPVGVPQLQGLSRHYALNRSDAPD